MFGVLIFVTPPLMSHAAAQDGQGQQKVDIMVGFRGLRSVTGGRNPSDGVDSAAQKFGGTAFEYSQIGEAYRYIMQRRAQNPNATIAIVGHSAGANSAIQLTRQLAGQNVRVAALVVADPSAGSAGSIPGNVVQAVGLFSNSGSYAGVNLRGSSPITNIRYPNLDHFGIDNKIEQHMPFVGCAPQCAYSGDAQCTFEPQTGKYNCAPGAAAAPTTQQQPPTPGNTSPTTTTPSTPSGPGNQSLGSGTPSQTGGPTTASTAVLSGDRSDGKTKDPFEVTNKKPSDDIPVESTDPHIAKMVCTSSRIRFVCAGRSTQSGTTSKPADTRWNTKGELRGIITVHPTRETTYELRCSKNRTVIAKATCTIPPITKDTKAH
jgi:hypothetical protein